MCSTDSVCRVCLAGAIKMHDVKDLQLIETYEKLTSSKLITGDGRPTTVCYMCYSQLQRCSRFSEMAHRTNQILLDLLCDGTEIKHNTIATLHTGQTQRLLSMSAAQHVSSDDSVSASPETQCALPTPTGNRREYTYVCTYASSPVSVKEEQIPVKEETTSEVVMDTTRSEFGEEDATGSLKEEQSSTRRRNENTSEDNEEFKLLSNQSSKQLKTQSHLKTHNMALLPGTPFSCLTCSKQFNKLINYTIHMRIHRTEEIPFACSSCDKTFSFAGHLNRHMRSHVKSYVCDRCSKKFKLKSSFEAHMRTHTGEKPFACEMCGKTFNQKSHLKTHMRTHTGVKPFACNTCGNAFRQRAQLISHVRSHTGERPFACKSCDMTFGHLTTLRKHMRLHLEAKPYACDTCSMSYDQECSLMTHMRVHTAQRPHACPQCDKSFLEARHLKEHVQSVHSGRRPYSCDRCQLTFKRLEHLKQHARSSKCKAISVSPTLS